MFTPDQVTVTATWTAPGYQIVQERGRGLEHIFGNTYYFILYLFASELGMTIEYILMEKFPLRATREAIIE